MTDPTDESNGTEEIGEQAQVSYDTDPLGVAIGYMRDMVHDLESGPFLDGYRFAVYQAVELYVEYSEHYTCECPDGHMLAALNGDEWWVCENCGTVLVERGEEIVSEQRGGA